MTWLWKRIRREHAIALPSHKPRISGDAVSLVVPVRNDEAGVRRLVHSVLALPVELRPREVLVVDNASTPQVRLDSTASVRLLACPRRGPASARNVGWRAARGPWVLFADADCVLTPETIPGFASAQDDSVAYAGAVRALDRGTVPSFYDRQRILIPPPDAAGRPQYLVTANALVLRSALDAIGGFNESFDVAGGEDIDLALRLSAQGRLNFAPPAVVYHEFGASLRSLVRRFARYGRGSRQIERLHRIPMLPRPFVPVGRSPSDFALAALQFCAMTWGYVTS